jgi:transcriptional regulator with XRE-family HTH domain
MKMKELFVQNLKKFRKIEGLSQMKLAEKCETDVSYIGQIEIGQRFPSIDLIEKMAQALAVEPYRLFMEEPGARYGEPDAAADYLLRMPSQVRLNLVERLNAALCDCVKSTLSP